ncbi:hypothetical protein [Lactococcus lactis]|nr:hypothetical protein [Lactococcus lactis]KSU10295.1 hypothetical protein LMG8526_2036 [Lactococcus lactis subsp. lactis]MCQ4970911.1 hypothetical protein [Lactococcus lactis]WKG35709.1 hypothetical protein QZH48_03605 [Lactococcus lactis subsp. lactis]
MKKDKIFLSTLCYAVRFDDVAKATAKKAFFLTSKRSGSHLNFN